MVDRISKLPDEVLCHILSFLPAKDVFATSIVSKRWKPLWLSVPCLDFDETRLRSPSSFIPFVDAAILGRASHSSIKTLHFMLIRCPFSHVKVWLNAAAERKLKNLVVRLCNPLKFPCCVFGFRTLVFLELMGTTFGDFSSTVALPSLK